ncbi:LysM peptidoglycan-binding domain-containing protein [Promicromonospora soli]
MTTTRHRPSSPLVRPGVAVTRRRRFAGALATLGICALLVGVPFLLIAAHSLLWPALSWADLRLRLAAPDDGTLLAILLTIVLWIVWAWFAVTVLIELGAAFRRVPAPRLPGLPQGIAGRLVATALALASVPSVAQAANAPAAAVVQSAVLPSDDVRSKAASVETMVAAATAVADPRDPNAEAANRPDTARSQTAEPVDYVVRPNETLWRIARERLGDPRRWTEIADLNPDLADPDFLDPGMVLHLPSTPSAPSVETPATDSTSYEVRPGDTLSEIARDELGDANQYPEIAAASSDTVQPDGDLLSDPDHIEPGWILTIPGPAAVQVSDTDQESSPTRDGRANAAELRDGSDAAGTPDAARPHEPDPSIPQESSAGSTRSDPTAPGQRAVVGQQGVDSPPVEDIDASAAPAHATPSWLLPGLTGAGALLAASVFAAFRRNRAAQWRYRRPGRLVAPTPPEAVAAERTAVVHGSKVVPYVERLDRLLKSLGGWCLRPGVTERRPPLVAVELTTTDAVVHLAEPVVLPEPWVGEGTRWSAPLSAAPDDVRADLAPYPLLVTVGQDADGHTWLIDLERAPRVVVTGDDDAALALGRAFAAELNLCPWACNTTTHTLGFAHEAENLSEVRGHTHREPDPDCLRSLARTVTDSPSLSGDDREWYHLVLLDAPHADEVDSIRTALADGLGGSRAVVAVVQCGGSATDSDLEIVVGQGRLRIESFGLDLAAAGLTQAELEASVALVQATDALADVVAPPLDGGVLAGVADVTGALLPEVSGPRPEDPDEPAGEASLLPEPTSGYVATAATLAEDVDHLAPVIVPETTKRVLNTDEFLDRDVQDWFGERVPRLMVLGPVTARALKPRRAEKKWPQILSTLTYLMHHSNGAAAPEIAEAIGEPSPKVRTYLSYLRAWFGIDARTGRPHAPKANESRAHEERGVQCYQIEGVLYDVDLFRRLRARGQARGTDGIEDLLTALRLVRGRPFDGTETTAVWQWAFQSNRTDLEMTAAIIDVAHIVADHGFEGDDLDLVARAVATATLVAPDDDVVVNDEVHLLWRQGHTELARRRRKDLLDGSDDGSDLGPVEAPERTRRLSARTTRKRG